MADRYWVGGTGFWTNTARWSATSGGTSGASVPTINDDVFIDANSGTGLYTVYVESPATSKSFRATSTSGCTVSMASGTVQIGGTIEMDDTVSFITGAQITITGSGTLYFGSGTSFINSPLIVDGPGITVTLLSAFSLGNSFTLTAGTFNLGSYTITVNSFTSTGSNVRGIVFGAVGNLNITNSSNSFTVSGTNFSSSAEANARIRMFSSSAKTFNGGGFSYPTLQNYGNGALTITGSNTFVNLTNFSQPTTFNFTSGTTQTVTDFGISGTSGSLVTIQSSSAGSQATLSKSSGIVNANWLSIKDINATGGATWNAFNSVDSGNNTGWLFPASSSGNMISFFM